MININNINPGTGYRVLVYDTEEGFDCAYYWERDGKKEWINKSNRILTSVTHWEYLPDSPKEKE